MQPNIEICSSLIGDRSVRMTARLHVSGVGVYTRLNVSGSQTRTRRFCEEGDRFGDSIHTWNSNLLNEYDASIFPCHILSPVVNI